MTAKVRLKKMQVHDRGQRMKLRNNVIHDDTRIMSGRGIYCVECANFACEICSTTPTLCHIHTDVEFYSGAIKARGQASPTTLLLTD